jgi:hypothetical protein
MKTTIRSVLVAVALLCCAIAVPQTHAVVPAPDGGYPGGNTAEGQNALFSLTTGGYNTALGFASLRSDTSGGFNTAVGAGALFANTGDQNTATGVGALLSNAGGDSNTATGTFALGHNNIGHSNTASGVQALFGNTEGDDNSAFGLFALASNTTGNGNTAVGQGAGQSITGDSNICIGAGVFGNGGENNTIRIGDNLPNGSACYIGGIFAELVVGGDTVICNSAGKVGTGTSSKRFKEAIKPMDKASEAILALKPVTFRYKKELDPTGMPQFGLVAEDVEKVSPHLVVHDKDGKPHSVRYDQVNAMLLNEFLKEHKKVENQQANIAELKATLARQQSQFESTTAKQQEQIHNLTAQLKEQAIQIQKVSARIELNKLAEQTIASGQ